MTPHVNWTVTEGGNGGSSVSTARVGEPLVRHSRAIREGDFIFVTGLWGSSRTAAFFGRTLKGNRLGRALEINSSPRSKGSGGKGLLMFVGPGSTSPTSQLGARQVRFTVSYVETIPPARLWSRSPRMIDSEAARRDPRPIGPLIHTEARNSSQGEDW